jgi:hypothetical protein
MLVTTFKDDIKQFKMFCYCLNKNWQGEKKLIVCLGHNDDIDTFVNIANNEFSPDWNIEVNPTIHSYAVGPTEQQVNAIYYSVYSGYDDVIVWDCKNFLLKPADLSTFKKDGRYRLTYILKNKKLVDMGYDLSEIADKPIDHLPAIVNIRPWIWNVEQLRRYWDAMNFKFGDFRTWYTIPSHCEIYSYLVYTLADPQRTIKFLTHIDTPLLFAGGWTSATYESMIKDVTDFDNNNNLIVWQHTRKLTDPRCLDVTKSVLVKYNIDLDFVKNVFES